MFAKATRKKSRLRLALIGASGSGKTLSALRIARGLGERIAVIDTERGSASKYAAAVHDGRPLDFDVCELDSFEPRHYVDAIRVASGYDVIVIDSLSHAWIGQGGIIDQKDKSGSQGFDAWRKLTPQHNSLVDAILSSPAHVIVTMRSKTEYVVEKDDRGKNVPRKVGTAPVQRDGMEYEFDVVIEIDFDHVAHVTKTRCSALDEAHVRRPGADVAATLRAWLEEGVDAPAPRRPAAAASNGAKDPALKTALRDELPACQHADAMRAWADTHAERLTGLANGARATAQQLVLEQCYRVCTTADGEVVAEHAQQLAAEVLQLAGLS